MVQHINSLLESVDSVDDLDLLAIARYLLDSIHGQIRAADEKIRVLFSGTALLAAALAFNRPATLTGPSASGRPIDLGVNALYMLLLACVAGAVTSAVLALLPRVRPHGVERSLYFFGHIAATSHDTFINEFESLPEDRLLRQLLSQVHTNSLIVSTKYLWTQRAARWFAAAVLLLVVKQGIMLFM